MKESSDKKYTGIQAVVWVIAFLILLIIFLIKQDDIFGVLKETAFFEHLFGGEPEFITDFEPSKKEEAEGSEREEVIVLGKTPSSEKKTKPIADNIETKPAESPAAAQTEERSAVKSTVEAENILKPESENSKTAQPKPTASEQNVKKLPAEKPLPAPAKMNQYLCFIVINSDGIVERKEVNRAVSKTNTPLTAALTALLEGPGIPELEKGYISLIPSGTRLLSARVQDKTAFINFSQEFAFNKYGVDGYLGQLMQVVYTATAFGTIENVQFLIEGQKNEYLGGEGVWIGTPLARYNFK